MAKPTTIELNDLDGVDEVVRREASLDKVLLLGGERVIRWIDDLAHLIAAGHFQGGPL